MADANITDQQTQYALKTLNQCRFIVGALSATPIYHWFHVFPLLADALSVSTEMIHVGLYYNNAGIRYSIAE